MIVIVQIIIAKMSLYSHNNNNIKIIRTMIRTVTRQLIKKMMMTMMIFIIIYLMHFQLVDYSLLR